MLPSRHICFPHYMCRASSQARAPRSCFLHYICTTKWPRRRLHTYTLATSIFVFADSHTLWQPLPSFSRTVTHFGHLHLCFRRQHTFAQPPPSVLTTVIRIWNQNSHFTSLDTRDLSHSTMPSNASNAHDLDHRPSHPAATRSKQDPRIPLPLPSTPIGAHH